jgi:hypothetical protein
MTPTPTPKLEQNKTRTSPNSKDKGKTDKTDSDPKIQSPKVKPNGLNSKPTQVQFPIPPSCWDLKE